MINDLQHLTGVEAKRIHVDKSYHSHNAYHLRVWTPAKSGAPSRPFGVN